MGIKFTFDWESEKPKIDEQRKAIEQELFDNLDEQARETLNQMMARQPVRNDQKFKLKNIKVSKNSSEMSHYKDAGVTPTGPPMFTYMPSKAKLIKILMKAAEFQASGNEVPNK